MTAWAIFTSSVLSLGLLLGSFLVRFEGWHWMIGELMWLLGTRLILLFFPKTSASDVLYHWSCHLCKAKAIGSFKVAIIDPIIGSIIFTIMSFLEPNFD